MPLLTLVAGLVGSLLAAAPAFGARVTVVPARHVPGQLVHATGAGFPAGVRGTARLGGTRVAQFRVGRHGRFSLRYSVPAGQRRGHHLLAVRAGGRRARLHVLIRNRTRTERSLSVALGARRLDLAPYTAAPSATRVVRGWGWPRNVRVRASSGRAVVGRARTTGQGRFSMSVSPSTQPGVHWVVVKAPRRRLAVPFAVTASPPAEPAPAQPPSPSPVPPPGGSASTDPRIAAAGDIACRPENPVTSVKCRQGPVSNLLMGAGLSAVLPLGDEQYDQGELANFLRSYEPTWGRVKSISHPAPGNKEYGLGGPDGYFDYFGARAGERTKGYYAFDLGSWRLYSLNSNCAQVACGAGSAQETWLRQDLAGNPRACQIAYWHHPLFNSGNAGSAGAMRQIWADLHAAGVDVVLTGHDHHYERFSPQNAMGVSDLSGPREFIVGTGGASHASVPTSGPAAHSEVRNYDTFGVLELTLRPTAFEWRFVPEAGRSFSDAGSQDCH